MKKLILIAIVALISSCKKDNETKPSVTPPVIVNPIDSNRIFRCIIIPDSMNQYNNPSDIYWIQVYKNNILIKDTVYEVRPFNVKVGDEILIKTYPTSGNWQTLKVYINDSLIRNFHYTYAGPPSTGSTLGILIE